MKLSPGSLYRYFVVSPGSYKQYEKITFCSIRIYIKYLQLLRPKL